MVQHADRRAAGATAALMFGANFLVNLAVSIVAPMLPAHLAQRQLLPSGHGGLVQGLLFSSSSITQLGVMPLGPKLAGRIGRSRMCGIGIVIFSLGMAGFGAADWLLAFVFGERELLESSHPRIELALLFLFRALSACGGTLACLSSMSLALQANPENRGVLMGASETAIGIGFSVGPSIGAAFFTAGGFAAPFVAAACIALGLFPLLLVAARATAKCAVKVENELKEGAVHTRNGRDTRTPGLSPWWSLSALAIAANAFLSMVGLGFLDPTLAPFESHVLGASTVGVGVLFSAASFPYALIGTVVGAIVDAAPNFAAPLVCFGVTFLGLSLGSLAPLVPFMATWAWQLSMLLIMGVVSACGMVPAVPMISAILEREAKSRGCPAMDEDSVLAFTYMAFTAGEMVGPLFGSWAVGAYGFAATVHGLGGAMLAVSVGTGAILIAKGQWCPRGVASAENVEPLLKAEMEDLPLATPRRGVTMLGPRAMSFEL
uniref:Major facilitator superfamily (MFS) profile domain-containing protein n=1 Tax=Pyrodinium bahamense TaxID=73915 RepID=A0A7S0AEH2_9DINO|mmetsp:Transcript_32679/g.90200  ORF Transcript_32679/g.90200 Transcript_32679/m.90200 type:complete len:490 (+) Transcript_32679:66-1535(+)